MGPNDFLASVGRDVRDAFVKNRRLLSVEDYLRLFSSDPLRHARNAAQYLKDTFDHFGTDPVDCFGTNVTRFKLFDAPFDGGRDRLVGQEVAQMEIYKVLQNFVREGRINRLILLHGPNGSAKSTLISCVMRAMREYSVTDFGALYKFNWIFPTSKYMKGGIGFGGKGERGVDPEAAGAKSFAFLEDSEIDARVACELRDHPIFLLPKPERWRFLETTITPLAQKAGFVLADYIRHGDLCHKCKQIFEAMLSAYQGDYLRVLQHVQVERFYPSRRYRKAIVSVEPQLSVDAALRQITVDRSLASLPTALQTVTLFEAHGELVDANRGILEFNDLLKRPLESYKYLLATSEKSTVALPECTLFLDTIIIATSNEKHLAAFKEFPDFPSFKGRIELVKVPYILQPHIEQRIYDEQTATEQIGRHFAPHVTRVAALWAVLTRLKRPMTDKYQQPVREILASLRPLEKARLYDRGEVPDRLSTHQAKDLRSSLTTLWSESHPYPHYEGRTGASPREVKTILLNAAQSAQYRCVHPLAVFDELRLLVRQPSVYDFLNQEVVDGYHDNEKFIETAWDEYLDWSDLDVRAAMGLVDESRTELLFEKYVTQVSPWLKKEKVRNRHTGETEDPDESLMNEIEEVLLASGENKSTFRSGVISQIAAWSIDHPREKIQYGSLFPKYIGKLNEAYYEKQKKTIRKLAENFLVFLSDERGDLQPNDLATMESMLTALRARGFCQHCARDSVTALVKHRYVE